MSFEEAFEALKKLRMDIDSENHLFVGTINPAWLDVISKSTGMARQFLW